MPKRSIFFAGDMLLTERMKSHECFLSSLDITSSGFLVHVGSDLVGGELSFELMLCETCIARPQKEDTKREADGRNDGGIGPLFTYALDRVSDCRLRIDMKCMIVAS